MQLPAAISEAHKYLWAFVFFGSNMHYFVYLDEFGHIGPFINRHHAKHSTSPLFGFAGIIIPIEEVRAFSIFFYQLKCKLLAWEIKNTTTLPPYQWEKKGSALYTIKNIEKYEAVRHATFRLINKIHSINGFLFYNGIEKAPPSEGHTPEGLYFSVLRDTIRRLDSFCANNNSSFSLMLDSVDSDEPNARRKFRLTGISTANSEMFGSHKGSSCKALLEAPYQLESHLYHTIQCADWFCGLLGRYLSYTTLPEDYSDYKIVSDYFGDRLQKILKAHSLRKYNL